ncbi:tRNA (adenosine(37)-N6)-dimethylallyltransferase MiaA [Bifidobacterium mongoliense]|uniref:tRNA (adenosine(37)-N6)-dimethylallyltransferase MiaA n=1 Tax=Bifidobacterium mongoliense TaxID=518643 RepID=UPI0030EC631A
MEEQRGLDTHTQERRAKVVSIIGPTASGKTGLGIGLARALAARGQRAEIVNADAYQMYRQMDIGTAKPTAQERAAVPHHLLDVIDPEDAMSVARFQGLARTCVADLQRRGIRPILVGGSGLYARAAIDDISFPATDAAIREGLERRAESEGPGLLFDELMDRDPEAARRMDPHNVRRTIRALEVIAITGRPYSASLPRYRYVMPAVQIGLDLPRDLLDERIERRTAQMRALGFTREVERLRERLGTTASRALGYPQIARFLDGEIDEDAAYAEIARLTKRLARKQMGWFGRDPRIHWLQALRPTLVDEALGIVMSADAGEYDAHDAEADGFTSHHLGDVADSAANRADDGTNRIDGGMNQACGVNE